MDVAKKIALVAEGIAQSRKLLVALGDESRQHLILEMMQMGDCSGVRVVDVAERTNLSRPAVSHHFQIMKDAGLLKTRKEGTKVYYYFDPDMESIGTLIGTLQLAVEITRSLPDRSGEQ
ncbi:MAG: ArsR/SmtB family transcription factor [Coriobacteriales bacterium]